MFREDGQASAKENAVPAGPRNGAEELHAENSAPQGYANDDPGASAKTFATRRGQLLEAAACDTTLTPVALRVLLLLALRWADAKTGRCWPAKETIAEAASTHPKTVQKALRELREQGWILVVPGAGRNGTNVYQVIHSRFARGSDIVPKAEPNRSPNLTNEPNQKTTTVPVERVAVENSTNHAQPEKPVQADRSMAEKGRQRAARAGSSTAPASRRIARDSDEWTEWQAHLSKVCIDPKKIPRCTMPDGKAGHLLPMRWPPDDRETGRTFERWAEAKGLRPTWRVA